jgi:serine/threonine protein kinase
VNDFDYFEVLGKGSFGVVIKCRKRSTAMMYAMKIVGKQKLLEDYADDTSLVTIEVKTLAAVRHPFIIGMDYSFQNATAAFIVMELAEGGTLQSITNYFRDNVLKERHIRFYIAEIAEALHYLHGLGLVYRDLKPANVLLGLDGHVKLADLGGVSDTRADVIRADDDEQGDGALNVYAYSRAKHVYNAENLSNPVRRRSVLGTRGYMAPEMLKLATCNHRFAKGYSYMADWWSMGVLVYVLLHGRVPFYVKRAEYSSEAELDLLYHGAIDVSTATSAECISFICGLIEVEDTERLGYGLDGMRNIKHHNFMASFDWANVMKRRCRPPIIPSEEDQYQVNTEDAKPISNYESLALPTSLTEPSAKEQELFLDWNYVSSTTLRIEMGMANSERQYEGNSKIQQLLGEYKSSDFSSSNTSRSTRSISYLSSLTSALVKNASNSVLPSGSKTGQGSTGPHCSPPTSTKTRCNLPRRK